MKRLSLVLTLLLTFACTAAYAQFTQAQLVTEFTRAKAYTKAYLDAMPEDGYTFKPKPEMKNFAQQMLHLADANYLFCHMASDRIGTLGKGVFAEETIAQTKAATTAAVMESYDYAIAALQGMSDAQMKEMTNVAGQNMNKFGIFGKAFEHQTHHRGQTTVYLRLKGVTPPAEMLF